MVTPLVTSLLHFHQYKLFKNMACILALFGLFWHLFKKLGYFFPNHMVTLVSTEKYSSLPVRSVTDKEKKLYKIDCDNLVKLFAIWPSKLGGTNTLANLSVASLTKEKRFHNTDAKFCVLKFQRINLGCVSSQRKQSPFNFWWKTTWFTREILKRVFALRFHS